MPGVHPDRAAIHLADTWNVGGKAMNYFEQELRRLFGNDANITDKRFVGRALFGKLTDNLRVRVEFVTLGTADHYEAIKATIINRNDGPVDALALRLSDLIGKKMVSNPNFRD